MNKTAFIKRLESGEPYSANGTAVAHGAIFSLSGKKM